jgi:hypothetical protein
MQTETSNPQEVSGKMIGWAALALFVLWFLAIVVSIAQSSVFPGFSDQFVPARIQANALIATLNWLLQLSIGTAMIALALPLSYYLKTPLSMMMRFALVAGVLGGAFFVAAGAGGQENVFVSLFYLTVWIGPITGFPSFIALQVWYAWLAIILLRSRRATSLGHIEPGLG